MKYVFLVLLTLLIQNSVYADEVLTWEVSGSIRGDLLFTTIKGTGGAADQNSTSTNLAASFGYFFGDHHWEALGKVTYGSLSGVSTPETQMIPLVGIGYNVDSDLLNSVVVGLLVGNEYENFPNTKETFNRTVMRAFVNRRVKLFANVTWQPELAYYSVASGTSNGTTVSSLTEFEVIPLQVSVLF